MPDLPKFGARKHKALLQDLYDNIELIRHSVAHSNNVLKRDDSAPRKLASLSARLVDISQALNAMYPAIQEISDIVNREAQDEATDAVRSLEQRIAMLEDRVRFLEEEHTEHA